MEQVRDWRKAGVEKVVRKNYKRRWRKKESQTSEGADFGLMFLKLRGIEDDVEDVIECMEYHGVAVGVFMVQG